MKDLQNFNELESSMGDKTNKIHLYFFHQDHCQLCKSYKKKFFPKLAALPEYKNITFALVNADDPLVHGYAGKVNQRDFVGFPFWFFYDAKNEKVLKAGASGIKDSVKRDLDDYVNGVERFTSYVVED